MMMSTSPFFTPSRIVFCSFGDLNRRERVDFLGVTITKTGAIKRERQLQPVAHEFEVAMDGLGADFELLGQVRRVGKSTGLNELMDPEHALQRWTRSRHVRARSPQWFHESDA